jgi:protein TonB
MESQSQKTDRLFRRCLLISLGLHLGLAGLGVMAGWGRMLPAPVVIQVSLLSGPAGEPGKAAAAPRGGPVQAVAARAARPTRAPKARSARRPPPAARPTPASSGLALEPAPLTLSSLPRARGFTSPGGLPGGRDQTGGPGGGGGGVGAGPGSGGGGGAALAQSRYFSLVRARILAHRHYPYLARQRQQQGTVRVRFSLSPGGHLCREVKVVRPSGFTLLDDQARQCVLAAAPFPPFPVELKRNRLTIEVPIIYRLTDGGI